MGRPVDHVTRQARLRHTAFASMALRILGSIWLALVCGAALARPSHKVLILDQGDFTRPFFVAHALAIRSHLTADPAMDIEVDIEMLDLDRFPDQGHRAKLTRFLAEKYRQRPPEVIVVQGGRAPEFATSFRMAIGKEIPIVYTLIEDEQMRRMVLPSRTTGVNITSSIIDEAKLIRTLLPGTMHLAFIGNSVLPGSYPMNISNEMTEIAKQLEVINLIDLPIDELLQRVAALPEHSAIFYFGTKADKSGRVFLPQESLVTLARIAKHPIFVPTYNLMGFGATGGLMVKPEDGTHEVAALVIQILTGADIGRIGQQKVDTRKPVFDYRQLQKWGIAKDQLPADSELMFYEPTVWEQYARQIVVIALVLVVQTALIVLLIVEHRRRRRVELEFRRSMSDLAHLNRSTALGELSASIAHELNQPLAAIMSNADAAEAIINKDPGAIAEVKLALADIRRDDQRASDIIGSMRALFGKAQFTPQKIDMNEVIREMLGFVAWEARSKGVEIVTELERNLSLVNADRIQLHQVVLNLLMNAIEATQSNHRGNRRVRIGTRHAGSNTVEVFVDDNGPGIPAASMSQIFEPHYTTKAQGMGMGLSISRTIIEAHSSRLNVRNLGSGGACFWFALAKVDVK